MKTALGLVVGVGVVAWLIRKASEARRLPADSYVAIDMPPIRLRISEQEASALAALRDQYLPEIYPVYLPPSIQVVVKWPVRTTRTFRITKEMTRSALDSLVWALRNDLQQTKIQRQGEWVIIDLPLLFIPA